MWLVSLDARHVHWAMPIRTVSRLVTVCLPVALTMLVSCGTPPQPEAPATATSRAAPSTPVPEMSAAPAQPAPSAVEPAPPPAASKPGRKPSEILTQVDVTFMLAFGSSDAGKAAEQKCAAEAAGDPSKVAPCMDRARDKVQVHAIRFTQDARKNWWWQSMHKSGEQYLVLHKVMIDLGDETEKTIAIKPKGKDQGMAPWGLLPKDVVIEVVDDYTIATQDPQQGRLVYEARIGIMK